MNQSFPAKISYALVLFVTLVFFAPLIPAVLQAGFDAKMATTFIFLVIIYILVLYLLLGTKYTIENNMLKIRSGFIQFSPVPVESIKEIRKTHSLLSAPAPSFDRILIKYGKYDEVIVSPKDKQAFINALKNINPAIDIVATL